MMMNSGYDPNSRSDPRSSPNEEEKARLLSDPSSWVASHTKGNKDMGDLVKGTTDYDLVELDSVGRYSLVHQCCSHQAGISVRYVLRCLHILGWYWMRRHRDRRTLPSGETTGGKMLWYGRFLVELAHWWMRFRPVRR